MTSVMHRPGCKGNNDSISQDFFWNGRMTLGVKWKKKRRSGLITSKSCHASKRLQRRKREGTKKKKMGQPTTAILTHYISLLEVASKQASPSPDLLQSPLNLFNEERKKTKRGSQREPLLSFSFFVHFINFRSAVQCLVE